MYQPEAYFAALSFMIVSMVCWGSWANTLKLTPGYAHKATMVSAVWGVFVGKEFKDAPASSRRLIPAMFFFFLVGLGVIAIAPMFGSQ